MEQRKKTQRDQDATYWRVLNSALELDFRKGHLKWTISELSRKSGITRSLIYYHFGRSKMALLDEAVRVIGEEVIGVGPDRIEAWRRGDWLSAILASRRVCEQAPFICSFYMSNRDKPTDLGGALRRLEQNYLKKLRMLFPHVSDAEIKALFAIFFGVVFAPLADETSVAVVEGHLKRLVAVRG